MASKRKGKASRVRRNYREELVAMGAQVARLSELIAERDAQLAAKPETGRRFVRTRSGAHLISGSDDYDWAAFEQTYRDKTLARYERVLCDLLTPAEKAAAKLWGMSEAEYAIGLIDLVFGDVNYAIRRGSRALDGAGL